LEVTNAVEPISIASTSGGVGVYLTDACEMAGVKMAKLSGTTQAKLGSFIPSFGTTTNPVDVTAQVVNDSRSLSNVLACLAEDEETGTMLFVLNGKAEKDKADEAIEIIAKAQQQSEKPLFVSWLGAPPEISRAATTA